MSQEKVAQEKEEMPKKAFEAILLGFKIEKSVQIFMFENETVLVTCEPKLFRKEEAEKAISLFTVKDEYGVIGNYDSCPEIGMVWLRQKHDWFCGNLFRGIVEGRMERKSCKNNLELDLKEMNIVMIYKKESGSKDCVRIM